jgi:hypothetical protein
VSRAGLVSICALCAVAWFVHATAADAVISQPAVIDGPNSDGITLGNVAMAPDGSGGLVYTKTVAGRPHVFASRFDGSSWSPPIRVDTEIPYEASEPRIAASDRGRLMVVWVAQVATLANGELRRGLYSAALGQGSHEFGSALLVDPNLKTGNGTDPSVAGTAPGKAIVAYRVVTHVFGLATEPVADAVQLRPGDVISEVRVARLEGDRWSRLGAINRNPAASMRPPSATNGPQVAIGATGRAAVAWQEQDQTGAARIWVRRVTGTTLGPIFLASPESFGGKPITDDATAFGLGVTETDRVRVAARVDGGPGSALGGQRMFLTSLASSASPNGAKPVGPEEVDGAGAAPPPGPLGPPAVAVADGPGAEGAMNLAYTSSSTVESVGVDTVGKPTAPRAVSGSPAAAAGPVIATVGPEGGSVVAYEASDEAGSPTVVVRQEFPEGELQTGLLYGPLGGSISQLAGAGSGHGDALLAFAQGESGQTAIVADRVSAPPENFSITVPQKWVRPTRAKVTWAPPPSAVGGLVYSLVVNGRVVRSNLVRTRITPPAALVGSGVSKVSVLATDRLGGEVLSRAVKLRVDGRPPSLGLRVRRRQGEVVLRLKDTQSGLARGSIRATFGDGSHARGKATLRHRYAHAGRFTVRVRARDRVGNKLSQRIEVELR